jgi:putative hydrolase of the HAD superfamily
MIKAVLFDLGNVIVPLDFPRGYRALEARCGVPAAEIPQRIGRTDLVKRYETGQIGSREFVAALCREVGLEASLEEFRELWSAIFLPHTLVSEDWVARLALRNRVVLLSNTNALHFDYIAEKYSILRHFERRVLSFEVGAAKPSGRIYEAAIELAECQPEECFFTDDIPAFVAGARKAGIDAEVFEGEARLQEHLAARGVMW